MCVNSTYFKNYYEQAGKREGGKCSTDGTLYDHKYGLETMAGDSNISPADKIRRKMWRPERIHLRLIRRIQHQQIFNVGEGGIQQVQLWKGHTSVPQERNEYRHPITNEAYRRQGRHRSIHQSEVCLKKRMTEYVKQEKILTRTAKSPTWLYSDSAPSACAQNYSPKNITRWWGRNMTCYY